MSRAPHRRNGVRSLHLLSVLGFLVAGAAAMAGCEPGEPLDRSASGAGDASDYLDHEDSSLPVIETQVLYSGDSIALPTEVALLDSGTLVVLDPYLPGIHAMAKETGEILRSYGREGRGPGEFMFPSGFTALRDEHALLVGDRGAGRILKLSTDSLVAGGDPYLGEVGLTVPFSQLLRASTGQLIASDLSGLTRFLILSPEGRLANRVGLAPGDHSSLPTEVAGRAFVQTLAVRPDTPLVASGAVRGGALAIYEVSGTFVDSVAVPTPFKPEVEVASTPDGRPVMQLGAQARYGYVALDATCELIIALFSGRKLLEYSREAAAGSEIHVFDWDGQLVAAYRLDRGLRSLTLDVTTGDLYGAHWGTRPAIVRFQLPDVALESRSNGCG